jgi:hypothetical protein
MTEEQAMNQVINRTVLVGLAIALISIAVVFTDYYFEGNKVWASHYEGQRIILQ